MRTTASSLRSSTASAGAETILKPFQLAFPARFRKGFRSRQIEGDFQVEQQGRAGLAPLGERHRGGGRRGIESREQQLFGLARQRR